MENRLAVVTQGDSAKLILKKEEMRDRVFDQVVWLRPPTDIERDIARTRLIPRVDGSETMASRMPLNDFTWDESPLIVVDKTELFRDTLGSTEGVIEHFTVTSRAYQKSAQAQRHQVQPPSNRMRLSTWLAHNVLYRMSREDVEEVLAACLARKLEGQ